jgi:hypothetical protein
MTTQTIIKPDTQLDKALYKLSDKPRNFIISAVCWHELGNKLQDLLVEKTISNELKISNYIDNELITRYFFIFIVVQPDNHLHDNRWQKGFSVKKHTLYNNLHLDYQKFEKATETEALTMQAEAYLEGILQIPTLRGMKKIKFDSQKFYDDCKMLFENVGWIKKEL